MGDTQWDQDHAVREWLHVLARSKWIVVTAALLVPLIAFLVSSSQQALYQASASVFVSQPDSPASVLGVGADNPSPPDRYTATQAALARSPQIVHRAAVSANVPGTTTRSLLATSSVTADPTADILTFTVTAPSPEAAQRLATAYAVAFSSYRRILDSAAITQALVKVRNRIAILRAAGSLGTPLGQRLLTNEQDLAALQALQVTNSGATVAGPASAASQTQPKTARNVALGLLLGLGLGVALAFLREALDTRVRSVDEVRDTLALPLLAHLPKPPRHLRQASQLVTLEEPETQSAEAFRMLRNNLGLAIRERGLRSMVITSASRGEGKSTTVANLAVALARSGRHVILLDLDLRQPTIDRFFRLSGRPGVADVALEGVPLQTALTADIDIGNTVSSDYGSHPAGGQVGPVLPPSHIVVPASANPSTPVRHTGSLDVLIAGQAVPDPGELLSSTSVAEIIDYLSLRCDVLLIDAPPLLSAGDAMILGSRVDGLILVTRMNRVRKTMLPEVRRLLDACPAVKLGFIAADSDGGVRDAYWRPPSRGRRRPPAYDPTEAPASGE